MHRRQSSAAIAQAVRRTNCVETLENRTLLSNTWFVATNGNDSNPGTLAAPFRTIQQAANHAAWGDVVDIRGGTYRETVKPSHGGITFQNYNGESVTVSGADQLTGWSNYSGNIYQAPMSWDLGEGNNQVFVNGTLVNEARWPNTSIDLSHPTLAYASGVGGGGSSITLYDSNLSAGWQGAGIHIMPGSGWYAQTGVVTASGQGWLTFNYTPDQQWTTPRAGNGYYLYGKFQGLDSSGEWYRDNSGKLYLWAPNNANPAGLNVEVKRRAYAFDLSGDSYTTLQGINIVAATIKTDGGSSNTVLNHLYASYISQFTWESIGWDQPSNTGIELNGNNSVLENSTIAWSAGDGVIVFGQNVRVTQNVIHDVDYNAGDSAAVRIYGNNASVDHNQIYNAGRCGIIDHAWGAQVIGNVIHDVMLQTSDGGGIYTVSQNGSGSQFSWNIIYNIHEHIPGMSPSYYSANGIFLDNSASNWLIQNNVIANVDAGVKMNFWSTGNQVLNNQLAGDVGSIIGNGNTGSWSGVLIKGNTLYSNIAFWNPGSTVVGNTMASGQPSISGGSAPAADPVAIPSTGSGSGAPSSGGSGSSGSGSSGSGSSSSGGSGAKQSGGGSTAGGKTTGGGSTAGGSTAGGTVTGFIGPYRKAPVSATSQIAAGSSASSQGTKPVADGSVLGAAGDWLKYASLDFGKGVGSVEMQLAAVGNDANLKVQVRLDSANGKVIGTVKPPTTKKARKQSGQVARVRKVTGIHDIFLVFVGKKGQVQVKSFDFVALASKS
jgi:hypothetical protein